MIIDDKGRLFGKINVIDFIVLLFLICIIPMFYFAYKIMTKPPVPVPRPPTVTLDKAEYEKKAAECNKLKGQRDVLLREHKGLRKYFK